MSSVIIRQNDPAVPAISAKLAAGAREYADSWTPASRCDGDIINEAKAALPHLEAALAPASHAKIEFWLRLLRKGCAAISDVDFGDRLSAVLMASADLPASVWSDEALRDALRNPVCRFFPSASDVDGMLRPRARAARHEVWLVRRVARAMPRRAPAEDKSVSDGADEVEAVQRCLATIKADNALRHRGQDMEKRHDDAPRPSHLNKTQIALSMPRLKAMERPDLRYALEQFERDDAAQLDEEAE